MKIEIKRSSGSRVLFSHEAEDNSMRLTLTAARYAGANLTGANLTGADLTRADLTNANLTIADLTNANLTRADLTNVNLTGADLTRADLTNVNLTGANLTDAKLSGAMIEGYCLLIGQRPIFQIGPIGSRCDYFTAYVTDKGLRFDAGCQRQITREIFESRLHNGHGDNMHAAEYKAALALIDIHAEIWRNDNVEE